MTQLIQSNKIKDKKELEQILDDAWLGIYVDEEKMFNPLMCIPPELEDNPEIYIAWLFTQPEYFTLFIKEIMNVELLPFQLAIIQNLWNHRFPMFIGSRGLGKTFLGAVYALMRISLLRKRKFIGVGAAFRQSKLLFEYMETIWKEAPILRDLVGSGKGGIVGPRRDIDRCRFYILDSVASFLPIGSGEKIRGERANDIWSDEFACCSKNTIIETNKGLFRISDITGNEDISFNNMDGAFEKPTKYFRTPLTDVYKITTRNGYSFKCSSIHQVLTSDGWKIAKDLTSSDYLVFDNKYRFPNQYIKGLDEDTAELFGILVAEGSINDQSCMSISTTDLDFVNYLLDKYKHLNLKVYERNGYTDKRGWNCKKNYKVNIHNKEIREQFYNLGLDYSTAHNKKIPWSILQSPESVVTAFLRGLFYGDGSCFLWSDKNNTKLGVSYYSVSEQLVDEVQTLLWKLNLLSNKQIRKSKISDNNQFMIRLNGVYADRLVKKLDIDKFNKIISNNYETLSKENIGVMHDRIRNRYIASVYYNGKNNYLGSFSTYKEALDKSTNFKKDKPICLKIKSVEKLPQQEHLYDFYLPQTNSFYGNGFVQHNSIPKDVFETVIAGFGVVSSTPLEKVKDKAKRDLIKKLRLDYMSNKNVLPVNNQIVFSGTAYYDFNHFADYWRRWSSIIKSKGKEDVLKEILKSDDEVPADFNWKDYAIIRIPYDRIPSGLLDDAMIARAKATIHSGTYEMEYGAVFSKDSTGFFRRSLIESCVANDDNEISLPTGSVKFEASLVGNPMRKYVFGIDPASEVDNFSIVILELHEDHRRIVYVWTTNRKEYKAHVKAGIIKEQDFYGYCVRKCRELMKKFPCERICVDSQGGGVSVAEAFTDPDKIELGELQIWPVIDPEKPKDTDGESGLHILEMINFASYDWTAEANHGLRKDFEDKVCLFPYINPITLAMAPEDDRRYDTIEDCINEIEELKNELSSIIVTSTTTGRDRWDTPEIKLPGNKKGRQRKDRYSALLMANYGARTIARTISFNYSISDGGFATSSKVDKSGKDYIGPSWFVNKMNNVY